TTREYILKQAENFYEKIDDSNIKISKCIIDLKVYTRPIKAHILYNHLYFSQLEKSYICSLLKDKKYLKIIDHKNYNPRIIQRLVEIKNLEGIEPNDYFEFFYENLENPHKLWDHAF